MRFRILLRQSCCDRRQLDLRLLNRNARFKPARHFESHDLRPFETQSKAVPIGIQKSGVHPKRSPRKLESTHTNNRVWRAVQTQRLSQTSGVAVSDDSKARR